MDLSHRKSRITRIPIDRKFVLIDEVVPDGSEKTGNGSKRGDLGGNFIQFSHDISGQAQDQQTKEDFESVWQMLAIVLSIAIMMVVFAIIVVQVMRLIQGRSALPSMNSLQMESEHDRLRRNRYDSSRVYYSNVGKRPVCQVILSSKMDINKYKAERNNGTDNWSMV